MRAPRLEIDLAHIEDNTASLVGRLQRRGIGVTAVTKAVRGNLPIVTAMLAGGAQGVGDSRIATLATMRVAGVTAPATQLRTPMVSEAAQVVAWADQSCNTEPVVLACLSEAAGRAGRHHGVILMVELGDLREGVMPEDLPAVLARAMSLPHLEVRGLGANLACRNGVVPDEVNMAVLDRLVGDCETTLGRPLAVVSGGNSANLSWALRAPDVGRVNDLRLGEALLLGCDPLDRTAIAGLHQDAFVLVAEVIESGTKPSVPWGRLGETANGPGTAPLDRGPIAQSILAIGRQDIDPEGLVPPDGVAITGCSSDHLLVRTARPLAVGRQLSFGLGYGALVRAMTSPFVSRRFVSRSLLRAQ